MKKKNHRIFDTNPLPDEKHHKLNFDIAYTSIFLKEIPKKYKLYQLISTDYVNSKGEENNSDFDFYFKSKKFRNYYKSSSHDTPSK